VSIKILGGFARGFSLKVPKGDIVRPTSVLLKRRVFDYFQDMSGVQFIDLCAGSGAIGIEAWSRGASKVYLNEMNKHVHRVIEENKEGVILKFQHLNPGEIICASRDAETFVKNYKLTYENLEDEIQENTVIFLDPPYSDKKIYTEIVEYLFSSTWFKGQLWIESDALKGIPLKEWESKLNFDKVFEQGDSYILITNFPQFKKI
jgi:16S rRNA (guanine966-N2)-methyltransferase